MKSYSTMYVNYINFNCFMQLNIS